MKKVIKLLVVTIANSIAPKIQAVIAGGLYYTRANFFVPIII